MEVPPRGDGKPAEAARAPPATTLASTTTWAGLTCYFFGSILFIAGALGFLLSTTAYVQSWLWPFQFGAFTWILGSLSYLAPLLSTATVAWCGTTESDSNDDQRTHSDQRCPWGLFEAGSALCLLAYVAGCSVVFFCPDGVADEAQVTSNLPAMNGLFTVGSAVLLVNPLRVLLVSRPWRRMCQGASAPPLSLCGDRASAVDWWFELVVAASFTYAGAAGGYGAYHDTITSGMVMWLVGSLVLFLQALYIQAVKVGFVVETEMSDERDSKRTNDDDTCHGSDQGTCNMESCV
jgi:hypothetical protein